ncbi:DEAD/DEAH box helicase [Saccharospirillum alexandrii]|uniref:DEAD/DEAH box helicase n=1 Tax=Saccharospirillum alexandrii TaxID=2448477 RepID=UPI0013E03400|nr:DEAD/DEAH box helicase [Saccharospirillum alexandrii]
MFDELDIVPPLSAALTKHGILEATDVQEAVIPRILDGKDLMVSAQTGSGKTVAFVLPMVSMFNRRSSPNTGIRALILAPTRELARQIQQVCRQLGSAINVTSLSITGGASFQEQAAELRKTPDILIATPGRLKEHLERRSLELSDIEFLVFDEADRMLDMGFRDDVIAITEHCSPTRQTLLFSATLEHGGVLAMAKKLLHQPETISLHASRSVPDNIRQQYMLAHDDRFKEKLIFALLDENPSQQVIIFTNTIVKAERLHSLLLSGTRRCGILHGNLTQEERNAVVSGMRSGKYKVLVTTDVAARGLDLPSVELVVNFDLARKGDEYLHRVGRTGRAGQPGRAVSLIGPNEWDLMARIHKYLGAGFGKTTMPGLTSTYQGPAKVRASGKAYGKKKPKKPKGKDKAKAKKPAKSGPRPSRPSAPTEDRDGGYKPMKRKKPAAE